MQSKAKTVEGYLEEIPPVRRAAIEAVRKVILDNLDAGYEEGMSYGIAYYVPHNVYPAGYYVDPKQPLPFANLVSQKNHMALYLMAGTEWLRREWALTGKKLDMGKSCIRFKRLEELNLDIIGEAIRRVPVKDLIAYAESSKERTVGSKTTKPSSIPSTGGNS